MYRSFQGKNIQVKIVEVGPRDGLQNEKMVVPTEDKIKFISLLADAGLSTIETTSFVRSDRVPQLADAHMLYPAVRKLLDGKLISFPCLVPNLKGLARAKGLDIKDISVLTSTSETFNKKNINASIDASLIKIEELKNDIEGTDIKMRGYISTVFGCPYEGETDVDILLRIVEQFIRMGIREISLGDTIGIATPGMVYKVLTELQKNFDMSLFALHFHDTRGMALSNIMMALSIGIKIFDSSAGGLGGCPYAKGASGNVATEEVIHMLDSLGIKTGVDLNKLLKASDFILKALNKESSSKFVRVCHKN